MVVRHLNTGTVHSDDYHPCQECDEARAVANLGRLLDEGDLGRAWAEAEAALPEGWAIDGLYRVVARTSLEREWEVIVHEDDWQGAEDNHHARGATPTAALRALAAKLREREG